LGDLGGLMPFFNNKQIVSDNSPVRNKYYADRALCCNPDNMKKIALLEEILNALLIILFLYTAVSKLTGHRVFRAMLLKSPLLGKYAGTLWWAIPTVELILVLLLLFPATRMKGLIGSIFLLAVFTTYIIYMVLYVPNLPCGCGGVLKELSWKQHIYFNLFFTGIALALAGLKIFIKGRRETPP
jgi:putative oxidoreductase